MFMSQSEIVSIFRIWFMLSHCLGEAALVPLWWFLFFFVLLVFGGNVRGTTAASGGLSVESSEEYLSDFG
jgi:hypothetical protein